MEGIRKGQVAEGTRGCDRHQRLRGKGRTEGQRTRMETQRQDGRRKILSKKENRRRRWERLVQKCRKKIIRLVPNRRTKIKIQRIGNSGKNYQYINVQ